uniref:Uncharacterized protein n=1 Tax=Curvibacter symbiont subsp. Hydra magnipapillata TaxID=667019 RepID=C9Y6Q5_CURXX|nr:hypothetical protein Csp_E36320 [Curvibacter putative symbiont of Hydra magnipapillata]
MGASEISTDTTTESFDVLASIGDTWRLSVVKATGAYTLTPNNSLYGLTQETGTLNRTVSGDFVTYALAKKVNLSQDTRTGALVGSMTVGSQTATVSGTPYQVSDATKLAGTYSFMGTTRDKGTSANSEFFAGQILISNDGTTATFCVGGKVDSAGGCVDVDTTDAATPQKATISLAKETGTNGGFYKLTAMGSDNQAHDWGNLMVQNGNLGTVLLIDRFGNGDNGTSSTVRVGNFYAVKAQTLAGTELDGSWKCDTSNGVATLAINGTTNTVSNPNETPSSWAETLSFNSVNSSNGGLLSFPSYVVTTYQNRGTLILPMSASLMAIENQSVKGISLCSKQ